MAYQGQFTSGSVLTAAELNVFTPVTVLNRDITVPDATETVVNYDSAGMVLYDAPGWHDTSTNPDRITPDVAGLYLVTAKYWTGSSSVDAAYSRFYKNGVVITESIAYWIATNGYISAPNLYYLTMNGTTDYLFVTVYQSSGASRAGNVQFGLQLVAAT